MRDEHEIRQKIERLEQLEKKHHRNGDWDSLLNVSTSIWLLKWVLDDDPELGGERDEEKWKKTT